MAPRYTNLRCWSPSCSRWCPPHRTGRCWFREPASRWPSSSSSCCLLLPSSSRSVQRIVHRAHGNVVASLAGDREHRVGHMQIRRRRRDLIGRPGGIVEIWTLTVNVRLTRLLFAPLSSTVTVMMAVPVACGAGVKASEPVVFGLV